MLIIELSTTREGDKKMLLHTQEGEILAVINILGIKPGSVKIGIEAPQYVIIDREKIYNRKINKEIL